MTNLNLDVALAIAVDAKRVALSQIAAGDADNRNKVIVRLSDKVMELIAKISILNVNLSAIAGIATEQAECNDDENDWSEDDEQRS